MTSARTGSVEELVALLSTSEPASVVYADVSGDQENPGRFAELRARGIAQRLEDLGAPAADIETIETTLSRTTGAPSPVSRFLVVRGGALIVDELLAGAPVVPERESFGPVPDVTPLLRHRPSDVGYVVVETQRGAAEVSLRRTAHIGTVSDERVEGRDDTLHKIRGGGWSHLRYQRHTEEIWRQNEAEVAAVVERVVAERSPSFVVAAGDPRAVRLLADELTEPASSLLTVVESNVAPEGSSDEALDAAIERLLAEHADREKRQALDVLLAGGPSSRTAATGLGETVAALQQSQVGILLLGAPSGEDETVLALDSAPWVATAPEESFDAGVLGRVPADVGLSRAALLTDARVLFLADDALPRDDDPLRAATDVDSASSGADAELATAVRTPAAVLRWPIGPGAPA